jgi:hypothetical protein
LKVRFAITAEKITFQPVSAVSRPADIMREAESVIALVFKVFPFLRYRTAPGLLHGTNSGPNTTMNHGGIYVQRIVARGHIQEFKETRGCCQTVATITMAAVKGTPRYWHVS